MHFLPSRELPTPPTHTNTVRALKHTFPACHTFALDRVHRGRLVVALASTHTDEQKIYSLYREMNDFFRYHYSRQLTTSANMTEEEF